MNTEFMSADELTCVPCAKPKPSGKDALFTALCNCADCEPRQPSLVKGFWRSIGFNEEEQITDRFALDTLLRELENEAEAMSPWERMATIFGCHRAAGMALDAGDWDGAGDNFVRALAWGRGFGQPVDAKPWPTEKQQPEVDRLCSQVLADAALFLLRLADEEQMGENKSVLIQRVSAIAVRAAQLDPRNTKAKDLLLDCKGQPLQRYTVSL
eukprot:TRINITY_DN61943_c0_g1_i1.p1 TRINITY_DN61943_c0_g1~~TRINITY_DN61943_c0_g1_i1.p1  ORF type:complete len:212 (-),score=37.43 TRINITY_DN61943_c0_g1_i1:45-680(-)